MFYSETIYFTCIKLIFLIKLYELRSVHCKILILRLIYSFVIKRISVTLFIFGRLFFRLTKLYTYPLIISRYSKTKPLFLTLLIY